MNRPNLLPLPVIVALLSVCLTMARAAEASRLPVAVAGFDYTDSSGVAGDQASQHEARLRALDRTIEAAIAANPHYTIANMKCPGGRCQAGAMDADSLTAAARSAHAKLLVYGGVHKASALIEWVRVEVLDLETGKLRLAQSVAFRGDTDEDWAHAARHVAELVGG